MEPMDTLQPLDRLAIVLEKEFNIAKGENPLLKQTKISQIFLAYKEIFRKAQDTWVKFCEKHEGLSQSDFESPLSEFFGMLPYVLKDGMDNIKDMERNNRIHMYVWLPEGDQYKLTVQLVELRSNIKNYGLD